jgi:hypothetical protein
MHDAGNYYWAFIALLFYHWVGDFVLQTEYQARNKSKNFWALFRHVSTYTATIGLASWGLFGLEQASTFYFIAINGLCHYLTDYCTSRLSARFRAEGDTHSFFVVIGFDQFIHQLTLAMTIVFLIPAS